MCKYDFSVLSIISHTALLSYPILFDLYCTLWQFICQFRDCHECTYLKFTFLYIACPKRTKIIKKLRERKRSRIFYAINVHFRMTTYESLCCRKKLKKNIIDIRHINKKRRITLFHKVQSFMNISERDSFSTKQFVMKAPYNFSSVLC